MKTNNRNLNKKTQMTMEFANHFASEWIDAWNSHDLDRILSHYSEDFTIETPMAIKFIPESNGIISGKINVRKYWAIGLEKIPNLKFDLIDLLVGVNGLAIYYINTATNRKSVEVMSFNNGKKVNKAIVNYSESE